MSQITSQPPRIDYTGRDSNSIRAEIQEYIKRTRPDTWTDFNLSNLGITLLDMIALTGDMLAYGQDSIASELFLATMRRRESALRFARSVGYTPTSAQSAEVTVLSESIPSEVASDGALIRSGSTLSGPLGAVYELQENVFIEPGASVSSLTLREGQSQEETFEGDGQPNQVIETSQGVVEDGSWEVFVGAVLDENRWQQVESVALAESENVYRVSFTGDGRIQIRFGGRSASSGFTIARAPSETITVRYRTTSGARGNAPLFAIRGTFEAEVGVDLNDENEPIPGSGTGTVASIRYVNSGSVATGGQDRETLEELRSNIPAFIQSVDKLIALQDYSPNIERSPGAGVAVAFTEQYVSSFLANHLKLNVWALSEIEFTSETPGDSANPVESTVPYNRFAQFPATQINDLRNFIEPRSITTVNNVVLRPDVTWVDLYFDRITYDSAIDRPAIHRRITQAVVDLFENSSGFQLNISDIYDAVENVQGVGRLYINRIVTETERVGALKFTGQPSDGDTLEIFDDQTQNSVTFEFDSNSSVTGNNVAIEIGSTTRETLLNLIPVVESNLSVRVFIDKTENWLAIEYPDAAGNLSGLINISSSNIEGLDEFSPERLRVVTDSRRDQSPLRDPYPPDASDAYEPNNYDPPSSFADGGGQNTGWQATGIRPYRRIADISTAVRPSDRRYYDETFLYNNEIRYDSTADLNASVTAINLRRLVFDLEAT